MAKNEVNSDEMERKIFRHKRRVRNQIISYVVLLIFLAGLAVGGLLGVKKIISIFNEKKEIEEQKQIEDIAQDEEEQPMVEAPEEFTEPEEETDYLSETVENCIAVMSLEDKVAGLFMITAEADFTVST